MMAKKTGTGTSKVKEGEDAHVLLSPGVGLVDIASEFTFWSNMDMVLW